MKLCVTISLSTYFAVTGFLGQIGSPAGPATEPTAQGVKDQAKPAAQAVKSQVQDAASKPATEAVKSQVQEAAPDPDSLSQGLQSSAASPGDVANSAQSAAQSVGDQLQDQLKSSSALPRTDFVSSDMFLQACWCTMALLKRFWNCIGMCVNLVWCKGSCCCSKSHFDCKLFPDHWKQPV